MGLVTNAQSQLRTQARVMAAVRTTAAPTPSTRAEWARPVVGRTAPPPARSPVSHVELLPSISAETAVSRADL